MPSSSADLLFPAVEITAQPVGATLCVGDDHFMSVQATEFPTYQWFKDGEPLPGATQFFFAIVDASFEDAGAYYVVATGACGSLASDIAVIEVNCGGKCPECGGS